MSDSGSISTAEVTINGQSLGFDPQHPKTLTDLLNDYGVDLGQLGIAIALNGSVLRRSEWASYQVKSGDQIEIVHAVAGG